MSCFIAYYYPLFDGDTVSLKTNIRIIKWGGEKVKLGKYNFQEPGSQLDVMWYYGNKFVEII